MAQSVAINDLKLKDVVSFSVYGANTLNNVVNATILGFLSGDSLTNPQAAAVNAQNIFPSIPVSNTNPVINDYRSYTYLKLKLSDNTIIEIAQEWIIPVSLTRLMRGTANVVISDIDNSQLNRLKTVLLENGFLVNNITFV